jgi:hypothetical protein
MFAALLDGLPGDLRCAATSDLASLDRIVHNAPRIELTGDSMCRTQSKTATRD